jgi:hypothetical protein
MNIFSELLLLLLTRRSGKQIELAGDQRISRAFFRRLDNNPLVRDNRFIVRVLYWA